MLRTLSLLAVGAVVGLAGCNAQPDTPVPPDPPAKPAAGGEADGDHAHKPTAHGGIVVPIGKHSYHGEAVFEAGGVVRFYTLGQDEAKVMEIDAAPLAAYAKPEGAAEAAPFEFKPDPQPGDAPGKTSRFTGRLPREQWGKKVEVTIPNVRIGGERFRVGFASAPAEAHADAPAKRVGGEEAALYLTPGGKYTAADVKANGGAVASVKFKGLKARHDAEPRPGDKLCPISLTKANPAFSWVIDGQTYEFCCPPCVDEFVQTAKDHPEKIKPAGEYRQK